MRKIINEAVTVLKNTSFYQLFISLAFYAFSTIYAYISGYGEMGIPFSQYALLLLFSFVLALLGLVFHITAFPKYARRLIHFAVSLLAFILIFFFTGKISADFSRVFIMMVVFTAIYFAVLGIAALFRKLLGDSSQSTADKKKTEKEPYQPMF